MVHQNRTEKGTRMKNWLRNLLDKQEVRVSRREEEHKEVNEAFRKQLELLRKRGLSIPIFTL